MASSAKPCHHFIDDQLRAVAARDIRDATKPAVRLRDHTGSALNERLDDQRSV